tara:strand:- start:282 stop:863 length:582 start_codon:yes stop_codon:yes gene_type:complete
MEHDINVINNFLRELKYTPRPVATGELLVESYQSVKDIVSKTKPKGILELGFTRGTSAAMWAHAAPSAEIISVDKYSDKIVKQNSRKIQGAMKGGRFTFIKIHHDGILHEYSKAWTNKFDLIYIDGDKDPASIKRDCRIALALNPKFIAFDDCNYKGIKEIIEKYVNIYQLTKIKRYHTSNGILLTANPHYEG